MIKIGKIKFDKNRYAIRRSFGGWAVMAGGTPLEYCADEAAAKRFGRSLAELPDDCRAEIRGGVAVCVGRAADVAHKSVMAGEDTP